jgi:DNA-binding NarL/FixJ family response regulator
MTPTDVGVPSTLVRRLAQILAAHRASHLVAATAAALAPHLRRTALDLDVDVAVAIDVRLVARLVGIIGSQRVGDLLVPVLAAARPWLIVAPAAADAGKRGGERPGVDAASLQLTEREQQVLDRMSRGASNPEIGRELYLSEDTVKSHARRLFRKIGARDRGHAVRIGFELGLLTPAYVSRAAS